MECSTLTASRRHSAREETLSSTYIRYVISCVGRHTHAAPYYKQLLDYLRPETGHGSYSLQAPRYYSLRKHAFHMSGGSRTPSEVAHRPPRDGPSIAILEGFPSPECISAIGANELVRPEIFIGHLDFSRTKSPSQRFFELPSLPSDRGNIIHVRLVTLGQAIFADTKLKSHAQSRIQADERCLDYESSLFNVKQYGATRFRKIHLHSSRIFSVEQMVSFSVAQRGNDAWCGTVLHLESFSGIVLTEQRRLFT